MIIRPIKKHEIMLLTEFLYEAIFQKGDLLVPRTIIQEPSLWIYIDEAIPEFAMSVYPEYRARGIGTALMRKMLEHLKSEGYTRASLAVQKDNYAVKMYKQQGFEIADENEKEYIMIRVLGDY